MKSSNNIPIIEHEDIINIFTENLRTKRKEKKYTQEQLAGMLGVTVKTYRSWEQDTLPKTIDLINLSIILGCDIDYLLGRINTDTHFKAYIDRTYALSQQSFDKLSLLHIFLTEKNNNIHNKIAIDWKNILDYLITTEKGNLLLDQIRQYVTSNDSSERKYCYHALLTGKECHGYNEPSNFNTLSDIINSLNDLGKYIQSINVKQNRAVFLDPVSAFLEVRSLDKKEHPQQKLF